MFNPLRTALCAVAALPLMAAATPAQELSIGFSKKLGKHSSIQVGYNTGFGWQKPSYGPVYKPNHKPYHKPVTFGVQKVWVPGRYETVRKKVWVPGTSKRVWVQPVYQTRYDACGVPYKVLVRAGHWETIHAPGCYQVQLVKVWKPGHWKYIR